MMSEDNLIIHADGKVERFPAIQKDGVWISGCVFDRNNIGDDDFDKLMAHFGVKRSAPAGPA